MTTSKPRNKTVQKWVKLSQTNWDTRKLEDLANFSHDIRNSWNLRCPTSIEGKWFGRAGEQLQRSRAAHSRPSVGVGIREYTSWWISGARVLFSVALSISLTLSPLTSHLAGLSGIYGSTELPLLGVRDISSVLLVPVQKENSRIFMGKQIKTRRHGLMWMFLLERGSILPKFTNDLWVRLEMFLLICVLHLTSAITEALSGVPCGTFVPLRVLLEAITEKVHQEQCFSLFLRLHKAKN